MKKILSIALVTCSLALPAQAALITSSFGYTSDTTTQIITNKDNTLQWLPFDVGNGASLTDLTNDLNNNDGSVLGLSVGEGWRLGTLSDLVDLANDVNPVNFFTFTQSNTSNVLRNTNAYDPGLLNEFIDLFGNTFDNSSLVVSNPTLDITTSSAGVLENGNFYSFFFDEGSNGQLAVFENTAFFNALGESRTTDIYPYAIVREVNAPMTVGLLMLGAALCFRRNENTA